ncbi:hypothetical protein [Rhodobaculum claviforme]|uniref:5-aminolevulic acid synthase n=1 Tax=Rhodobaculum claviforme TaxID=1549854 RepID=A0A934WHP3_9RHOB|nr:hypothetical protein [Rhodobaculum claviforme]MBK5926069.1 hypothetical protein [Rhodobaculum claviforme]
MRPIPTALVLAVALGAGPALAADTRTLSHPTAEVTLHLHAFLSPEDRALLEAVAASPEGLAMLLGDSGGHGAIALAPGEGMVRDGVPSASAAAVGALPDAAVARARALEMCDAARSTRPDCAVVLEVAPR